MTEEQRTELPTNDPTNPAHRLARDLDKGLFRNGAVADDIASVLATIARLEADKVKDGEALKEAEHALTQFTAFELDCREIMGNTNFAIVQHNHTQVRARLSSRAKDQSQ